MNIGLNWIFFTSFYPCVFTIAIDSSKTIYTTIVIEFHAYVNDGKTMVENKFSGISKWRLYRQILHCPKIMSKTNFEVDGDFDLLFTNHL